MKISKEDLAERFRTLADEVLLDRVRVGTLTPLALEVALEELRSRGIEDVAVPPESEQSEEQPEESADPDPGSDVDLVTIARFSNPLEANVLRNCLESHGIFAFVWGEHLGTAHLFLSVASGGMRVQVRADQVEQAKEVIAALERGEFSIDEEPE
jgi:hypothetical protein